MLNKRRKILLLLCGCSLLLSFYHLRDYEYDKLYEQNVKDNVQELVQRVQKIWILEHKDDSPSTRTPLPETTTLSDATTQRFPVDPGRGKANFTGDKSEVAFPSTTNCSKDQNPKSTRKKGPFVPTLYGYPCRKWQASSPRNRLWPAVLPPSKGSVLEEAYVRFSDSKVKFCLSFIVRCIVCQSAPSRAPTSAELTVSCPLGSDRLRNFLFYLMIGISRKLVKNMQICNFE